MNAKLVFLICLGVAVMTGTYFKIFGSYQILMPSIYSLFCAILIATGLLSRIKAGEAGKYYNEKLLWGIIPSGILFFVGCLWQPIFLFGIQTLILSFLLWYLRDEIYAQRGFKIDTRQKTEDGPHHT